MEPDQNAFVWPLPYDVTVKVFSMIDTESVCNAAATCLFFHKCAMDPFCYAHIHLLTLLPKANNSVVSKFIQRAGNALQSIKVGLLPHDEDWEYGNDSSSLTTSCLSSLNGSGGAPSLRSLHIYNIEWMDNDTFLASLSVCSSLVDLEIVFFMEDIPEDQKVEWNRILKCVNKHCPLLERLVFETCPEAEVDDLELSTCTEFVTNCPNITTLALTGFNLSDSMARRLVKGFHKLKCVDFSMCYTFTGSFLKNLGTIGGGNSLEVMILCQTTHLKKVRVEQFIEALLAGHWRSLRYLDISSTDGLASDHEWSHRLYNTSFIPTMQLLEQRPNLCVVASFPDSMMSSDEQ